MSCCGSTAKGRAPAPVTRRQTPPDLAAALSRLAATHQPALAAALSRLAATHQPALPAAPLPAPVPVPLPSRLPRLRVDRYSNCIATLPPRVPFDPPPSPAPPSCPRPCPTTSERGESAAAAAMAGAAAGGGGKGSVVCAPPAHYSRATSLLLGRAPGACAGRPGGRADGGKGGAEGRELRGRESSAGEGELERLHAHHSLRAPVRAQARRWLCKPACGLVGCVHSCRVRVMAC
jgi:hypothetical protein